MHRKLSLLAALSILGGPAAAAAADSACSLRETVTEHLRAVEARDLSALLETITAGEALPLLFGDGRKLDTRREFVALHEAWFADDSWRMQMRLESLIETAELGHALVRYRYTWRRDDGAKAQRESWLTLLFALEDDCWRLVFDQNTPIETS